MKQLRIALFLLAVIMAVGCNPHEKATRENAGSAAESSKNTLHFASFGGSFQTDLFKMVITPICKEIDAACRIDTYGGEYDHLAATIKNGTNPFDLVHVETRFLIQGGKRGLLTPIDWDEVDGNKLVPGARNPYGVGLLAWSLVLAWNQARIPSGMPPPSSWKDFFDVKKYPGPRAMRKTPEGNIELALLADGVPAKNLYDKGLDVNRALQKLSTIRPYISWWSSGAELQQKLSNSCIMAAAWNGRVFDLRKAAGVPVDYTYADSINQFDWWVVPANSRHKNLAMKFLSIFVAGQGQAAIAENYGYGPVTSKVLDGIPLKVLNELPSYPANAKEGVSFDGEYWAQNEAAVQEKWNHWLLEH